MSSVFIEIFDVYDFKSYTIFFGIRNSIPYYVFGKIRIQNSNRNSELELAFKIGIVQA